MSGTARTRPVALVTGGSRGIGRGIVQALAAQGFDIAATGLDDPHQAEAALKSAGAGDATVPYFKADLADLADHDRVVKTVISRFGGIDCLVNNAGIGSPERGDFLAMKPENFDTVIAVNLRGTVFFTQAVARAMLAARDAPFPRAIVNITSVSAELASPERLDYCMSKAGLAAFTKGLALRLADSSIAVFEVRPGIIRTGMTAGVSEKYDRLIADGLVPMARWGEAGDIGAMVAGLASGAFRFATGSILHGDGGLSIGRL